MKWLYRIVARIMGCRHRWKDAGGIKLMDEVTNLQYGLRIVLKCEKCGWVRSTRRL